MGDKENGRASDAALMGAIVRVPDHVAYRAFDAETVLLNLSTGQYHGLNRTGARMLETLEETGSVSRAAEAVAREFDQPLDVVTHDVLELCHGLLARGLIELEAPVE